MKDKLSCLSHGFRKNHSTQNCLRNMLEEWKDKLDTIKSFQYNQSWFINSKIRRARIVWYGAEVFEELFKQLETTTEYE